MTDLTVEAPVITYAVEGFGEMGEDIKPLIDDHWKEIALYTDAIPLDPDWDRYKAMNEAGTLRGYSVRADGRLIGYAIFVVVDRHMHYRHRWALNDIIFILPEHRNFGIGSGLFDCFEADLKKDGPIVINISSKTAHPALAMLLKIRGYDNVELGFGRRFGD